jgi:hypothetical protein
MGWFACFHAWLCQFFFNGELPDWLLRLHELLGLT